MAGSEAGAGAGSRAGTAVAGRSGPATVRRYVRPVVAAGTFAGLAFAAYSMVASAVAGRGIWLPLNLAAHTLWRGAPTDGRAHPGGIVVGLGTIVVSGVVVLVPYAAVVYGSALDRVQVLIGGVVYGNAVWIIGQFLVWPRVDPEAAARFSATVAWVAHMVAGLVGALALIRFAPTTRGG